MLSTRIEMLVEGDNDLDVRVANFTKCNNLFLCWENFIAFGTEGLIGV